MDQLSKQFPYHNTRGVKHLTSRRHRPIMLCFSFKAKNRDAWLIYEQSYIFGSIQANLKIQFSGPLNNMLV